ncbi:MAG: 4Fe-4S dicluster domain-containing protein [Pseudomonadota bacterium]
MVFNALLYISLAIFILGLVYKISTWFSRKIGISAKDITTSERVFAAAKGILGVIFSSKILVLIKVFILDVLLQKRILKENLLRWLMHMLIYGGFMLLLLMHALDEVITVSLFSEYYSTLNPFLFLRDLFGVMVIAGLGIAVYRRFVLKVPRLKTNAMDHYAIIILAVIMISGVLLQGTKITSHTEFQNMVENWSGLVDEKEIRALESYWIRDFGVVSPNAEGPFDQEALAQGREIHEMNCADCHSSPKWAFTGYALAKILNPIALTLDRAGSSNFLWYIHILACFFGLAYLPFSKMFHIIASPISLLVNAVMEKDKSDPANIATRQAMELDACMHCGTCSLRCSVVMAFEALGNEYILPSEKMAFLRTLAAGKELSRKELRAIQEGVHLCTNCDRCTVVCPAGINLKELWLNVRENLVQRRYPEPLVLSPFSFVRGLNREELADEVYSNPLEKAKQAVAGQFDVLMAHERVLSFKDGTSRTLGQTSGDDTFAYCFGCQNCTTICPVVGNYDNPEKTLGLLPHQIMCCLGLGLLDMASGPRMLWDCVTCYQCQEHCPQNVRVTDLLYQLKNLAVKRFGEGTM